ncbi:MAG: phosphotransferase, partial [Chloroflexota bacterium]
QGRSLTVAPLPGGLTNINYRIDVDHTSYVVRIPGRTSALLAIDPAHCYHNTLAAARAGVGARLVQYLPSLSVMVLEFIAGSTLSGQTMRAPGTIPRVVHAVRRLHAGPPFANRFNLFRTMDAYLTTARHYGITLPDGYDSALTVARRIEEALEARPLPLVPCHNDLMPENFIDDGTQVRLVDYDYSGANDPCCDLGYIGNEGEFAPHQVEELCAAYFGQTSKNMLARVWLYRAMTNLVSTLWAAIQHTLSEIEYDFWGLALERWQRARDLLASPEFGGWLRDA